MEKQEVRTSAAPEPVGPYSQAIKAGEFVFCSGQIAINPDTGKLDNADIETETRRVMENLNAILDAAESSIDNIVKTTIFVRDISWFKRVNTVYESFFKNGIPPARSTIQAADLPMGAGVEIECIALVNNS